MVEGGIKTRFIYKVLFFNNQESKQEYYGTLVQFFSFHLNGHTLGFYSTQKLDDKQHQQESQAKKWPFKWKALSSTFFGTVFCVIEGEFNFWVCE